MSSLFRDRLGFVFFALSGLLSLFLAWQRLNLLVVLAAFHNLLLAAMYASREPEKSYDRTGLWLGLLAAFLPMPFAPVEIAAPLMALGLAGYALVFWSLLALGPRFGLAPADRGLVTAGPYRLVRHPMYLGELILRGALILALDPLSGLAPFLILVFLQCLRSLREEKIIQGYEVYARQVKWRLIPLFF
jgi:hypothetical protein